METLFFCKIPIFDRYKKLRYYELAYSSHKDESFNQIVKKLYSVTSDKEITKILSEKTTFIKISSDILIFTEFLNLVPNNLFIFELKLNDFKSNLLKEKVKEFKNKSYSFSVELEKEDLYNLDIEYFMSLLGLVEYISIDISKIDKNQGDFIREISQISFLLKAENVDTPELFNKALDLNFDLFEGDFFSQAEEINTDFESLNKLEILKLVKFVNEENDLNIIAERIKSMPEVSIALLKYINSSFFYLTNPITSVNRAVAYLGKKNLFSWLILVSLMSVNKDDIDIENMKKALFRAKFMELLSKEINPDINISDTAFLFGILSLAEPLFKVSLSVIIDQLNLSSNIENDIKEEKGYFGDLLKFTKAVEKRDENLINEISSKCNLDLSNIGKFILESYKWVENITKIR